MTATDPTRRHLFDAILAEPDEDTPRLAYADLLDESGDPADADLAALIRVQCQLDSVRASGWHDRHDARTAAWSDHERELLAAHPDWHSGLTMPCPGCGGKGSHKATPDPHGRNRTTCDVCLGTGDLLLQMQGLCTRNPTISRGLTLRVGCRLDEVMREVTCPDCERYGSEWDGGGCPTCSGTVRVWQLTPWARAMWAACVGMGRIPEFEVTDREPMPEEIDRCYFQFWAEDMRASFRVPEPVIRIMATLNMHTHSEHTSERHLNLHYPTPDLARAALRSALYRWARQQVTPTGKGAVS